MNPNTLRVARVPFGLFVLGLVACGALLCPALGAAQESAGRRNVLTLHSYHPSVWTDNIQRGYEAVLGDYADVDISVEYMDAKRDSTPAYQHALFAAYQRKYRKTRFDVVLTSDNIALEFALQYRRELFPDAPIVFCGVNGFSRGMLRGQSGVTGVIERGDFAENIKVARTLWPQTDTVYVVADRTTTGEINLARFRDIMALKHPDLAVIVLRDFMSDDLLRKLSSLPQDSFVFLISFWRDMLGDYISEDRLHDVLQACSVPVFSRTEWFIGAGVMGGKCVSGFDQGRRAGLMAARILSGDAVEDIPVQHEGHARFLFDQGEMEQHGINAEALPPGSEVLGGDDKGMRFRPVTVMLFGGAFAALFVLVVGFGGVLVSLYRSRRALEAERDRSARIIEKTPAIICGVTADGETTFLNPFGEAATGFHQEELVGRNWWTTFYPGESYAQVEKLFSEMQGLDVSGYEMDLTAKDGTTRTIMWTSMNRFAPTGELLEVVGFGDDVTERRAAERALRESEGRYRLLFEAAHDGIVILRGGRLWDCNPSCEELMGVSREEILGTTPSDFSPRVQPGGELSSEQAAELLEAAEQGHSRVFEWRHRRADGTMFDAEVSLSGFVVDNVNYVQAIVRDVTEMRRMRELMTQNEKMLSLGGLAAGMAHELNNPLGAVLQSVQNIERRFSESLPSNTQVAGEVGVNLDAVRQYLERRGIDRMLTGIRQAGTRAASIVRNMLEFSDSVDGGREPCRITECVDRAMDLLAAEMRQKQTDLLSGVRIEREFDASALCVPCNRAELEQVLLNVLRNAVQAVQETVREGEEGTLRLTTRLEGGYVVVEVEDNGPGVPEADRRRVFEPFFTTRDPGEGTGLGLSVSYFIVTQNHGGEFYVEPAASEKGARFVIRLPYGDACRVDEGKTQHEDVGSGRAAH